MRVKFRPMPWLTAIVAIMLAILISLGVWQYKRLQWKTTLLAEVEASVTAPPLTSLDDLERAIAAGEPVDFRRIAFMSSPSAGEPIYAVYRTQQGGIYWDLYQRYGHIYGLFDTVIDSDKPDGADVSPAHIVADVLVGYVRENHPMGRIEAWSKSNPALPKIGGLNLIREALGKQQRSVCRIISKLRGSCLSTPQIKVGQLRTRFPCAAPPFAIITVTTC